MRLIRKRKVLNAALQAGFVGTLAVLLLLAVLIGRNNLQAQGITSGFAFLDRATGFDVGYSLIAFEPSDTFSRLLLVGLLNTMFLGLIGITLATAIGLVIAVFRISSNATLNALGTLYIEIFRNIPMILQAFFFYALMTSLPRPQQAYELFGSVFLTSRGIYLPGLNVAGWAWATAVALGVLGLLLVIWVSASRRFSGMASGERTALRLGVVAGTAVLGVLVLGAGRLADTPLVSLPHLRGLNFRDGLRIPPELSALAISIGIYGGSYMAEIFRAGFLSVGRGQIEAARALGLRPWHVFSRVQMPLALRAVLPTLTNQYVWLFKATTLGIAVGFTDFFMVVSVSINQAGQTLELIGILMLGFLVMNKSIAFVMNRINKAIALKGTQLRS
jgi:His/Glu/Gln/Arg/opine family amino acid ABC transporter permease subunit